MVYVLWHLRGSSLKLLVFLAFRGGPRPAWRPGMQPQFSTPGTMTGWGTRGSPGSTWRGRSMSRPPMYHNGPPRGPPGNYSETEGSSDYYTNSGSIGTAPRGCFGSKEFLFFSVSVYY